MNSNPLRRCIVRSISGQKHLNTLSTRQFSSSFHAFKKAEGANLTTEQHIDLEKKYAAKK